MSVLLKNLSKKLKFLSLVPLLFATLSCVGVTAPGSFPAYEKYGGGHPQTISPPEEIILGGYTEIAVNSEKSLAAYNILQLSLQKTNPDIKLGEIVKSESAAVSGYKIRLTCTYLIHEEAKLLLAVVYTSFQGESSILELQLDYFPEHK